MRFLSACLIWFLSAGLARAAEQPASFNGLGELQQALQRYVEQPKFSAALLGVKAVSLETGQVLFEHNANRLLKPASNAKLYSGALALARLGPEARIRTSVYAHKKPNDNGILEGDLIIYGRGDPSFSARFFSGDYNPILDRLVKAIVDSGLKKVNGSLVADDTFYSGAPFGQSWTWEDLQYYYGAEVSALSVQDNVVDLVIKPGASEGEPCNIGQLPALNPLEFVNRTRTVAPNGTRSINIYRPIGENKVYVQGQLPRGGTVFNDAVTVSRPALWFVQLLGEALAKRGIEITAAPKLRTWPADPKTDLASLTELAYTDSPPMSELVEKMMKPSQNLYAQLLLLQVGAQSKSAPAGLNSEDRGLYELNALMRELGIPRGEVLLEEGSGLSRGALVTPNATIKLLLGMRGSPAGKAFIDSLPAGGVDGTLRSRFGEPGLRNNVRAKTGTIRHVNTLSGFLTTKGGEQLVFSIMLNAYYNPSGSGGRNEIDEIVRMLYRLGVKSGGGTGN